MMNILYLLLILLLLFIVLAVIIFNHPAYGRAPSGERKIRLQKSKHYNKGKFWNLNPTPSFTEGYTPLKVIVQFLWGKKNPQLIPKNIPSLKTAIQSIPKNQDIYIWLGHSSYYIQLDGVSFLIDPVFSTHGAPFPLFNKAFEGTTIYKAEDFNAVDYLIITHDHYDHLDYPSIKALKNKVHQVILPLGVGEHFEYWGYAKEQLIEEEWYTSVELKNHLKLIYTPARHFSGRKFSRNNTLWTSYVLHSSTFKIYLGGDSGYDTHFKSIGEQYGPFDFAILENGQYDKAWRYIHTLPEDVIQAAIDINAKKILPVHYGKFALANHAWDEPLELLSSNSREKNIQILTPKLGETVFFKEKHFQFEEWWKG